MNWIKQNLIVILPAIAMGYGWGWRGDYGHETGAMIPGILVALAVAIASGRQDFWKRLPIFGLFGAIGWGFGGSMSYGIVLGYTQHTDFWNAAYGYGNIFIIGGLWGLVGGAFLGMAFSYSRSRLNDFVWPVLLIAATWGLMDFTGLTEMMEDWEVLTKWDVDWYAAISALLVSGIYYGIKKSEAAKFFAILSIGWILGFAILTLGLGLRMTPPRSDNWSGIVGLAVALMIYLYNKKDCTSIYMGWSGALFGGFGFSIGAFIMTIQQVAGWPVGGWRLMEEFFGFLMGLGIGLAMKRYLSDNPSEIKENANTFPSNALGYGMVLIWLPWFALFDDPYTWITDNIHLVAGKAPTTTTAIGLLFGIPTWIWIHSAIAVYALILICLYRKHQESPLPIVPNHPLGRAQLVMIYALLFTLGTANAQMLSEIGGHSSFFAFMSHIGLALGSVWLLLLAPNDGTIPSGGKQVPDIIFKTNPLNRILWILVPAIILGITYLATTIRDMPSSGSHLRF
ncbi:MAG: hypothetical protein HOB40_06970 [Candidatus Marinimicrobia bacterium]|jgi:hypothetical protein|nr:hypothetical protein [Candidatus Neomarinimicrobiota bacterium]MBT3502825.1 hypothetical protein [Candidatus Neomarinimicrobiota bacterium]MBT3838669.1 hypothetical protein [Candidatus Neomarinimicrobiota bacterium]MBT4000229.1 hypothetical protein [Candidatus Neomarinimicrobiota bacterium]MBT4283666.1 hypothetical protein [Candidatus Neomarinimicrobiota bacterium]